MGRAARGAAGAVFFWQGIGWGLVFCALWAGLDFCVWARACSFVASLSPQTLTIQVGITFCTHRALPRRSITSVVYLVSPLLRLAGCGMLLAFAPGCWVALPGLSRADAQHLHAALLADRDGPHGPSGQPE